MTRDRDLADLAGATLDLARELQLRHSEDGDVVEMTPTERTVMRLLDETPGLPPSRIGEILGIKRSNVSAALRELQRKGLVTREADPADARSVRVAPTPLAARNLERLREIWARALREVVPPEADVAGVRSALETATSRLAALRQQR